MLVTVIAEWKTEPVCMHAFIHSFMSQHFLAGRTIVEYAGA